MIEALKSDEIVNKVGGRFKLTALIQKRMLELMEDEVRIALALLGVDRLAALDPSYVHASPPVALPHVFSAFPLLDGPDY